VVSQVLSAAGIRIAGYLTLLSGYALTLIAVAFSVYLTYREVFTIHAICSWCVSSAVVLTLLAIVGSRRVLHSTYGEAGPAPARA
jgi:uncharacterized membrane protein